MLVALEERSPIEKNIGVQCDHCGDICQDLIESQGKSFCCHGCESVYFILEENQLQNYYSLKELYSKKNIKGQISSHSDYAFLEDPDFLKGNAQKLDHLLVLSFFLENVHCPACLWLIESLPKLVKDITKVEFNFSQSLLKVFVKDNEDDYHAFSQAASTLNLLGYKPHIITHDNELENLKANEDRDMLIKIGVAASCSMNLMLYSVSLYAGADGIWKSSFGYISLALSLPVMLYSALPFYRSAWAALKNSRINIDFPLSVAIILGFLGSLYFLFSGSSEVYFDTISTLVFLILLTRYGLSKANRKILNSSTFESFFYSPQVEIFDPKKNLFVKKHSSLIKKSDLIKVAHGELIPVDGEIRKGESHINMATLTGEAHPITVNVGDQVFAGTRNLSNDIEIQVSMIGDQTKVGRIFQKLQKNLESRSYLSQMSETYTKWFSVTVLGLFILSLVFFSLNHGLETAFSRSLALIIVSCPCAFALATPLVFNRSLTLASKLGILVKDEVVFERMNKIKNIFFDKTGTLTKGSFEVKEWRNLKELESGLTAHEVVFLLEEKSLHPIAQSLRNYLQKNNHFLRINPTSF